MIGNPHPETGGPAFYALIVSTILFLSIPHSAAFVDFKVHISYNKKGFRMILQNIH